jgi:hypothetical protein
LQKFQNLIKTKTVYYENCRINTVYLLNKSYFLDIIYEVNDFNFQLKMDIQSEISRFEEEITKLAPSNVNRPVIPPPPPPGIRPRMSIQLPSQIRFNASTTLPSLIQQTTTISSTSVQQTTTSQGLKRDISSVHSGGDEQKAKKKKPNQNTKTKDESNNKPKKIIRMAGGQKWEDETLLEWNPDDFRLFCGDLGNEVNDDILARAFSKYPSFQKAKVIRDKRTSKSKGYGFVSFKDSNDFIKAMREMNGKYVGNRPIKLRKSSWKDRNMENVKKKEVEKIKMGLKV